MYTRLFTLLLLLLVLSDCAGQPTPSVQTATSSYTFKTASRDGTGKFYFSCEISFVMGSLAAGWLEREENVSQAIANLEIQPDEHIADIGAGSGYYAFRMANKAQQSKVYAVDLQPEILAIMDEKITQEDIKNVELVQGTAAPDWRTTPST
ncbi:MAG: methyltransferase domain-containing protein [Bacteroidota bacterium]